MSREYTTPAERSQVLSFIRANPGQMRAVILKETGLPNNKIDAILSYLATHKQAYNTGKRWFVGQPHSTLAVESPLVRLKTLINEINSILTVEGETLKIKWSSDEDGYLVARVEMEL